MDENVDRRYNVKQTEKLNFRVELDKFESSLAELKLLYEQYFSGIIPIAPEKLHKRVKRHLRMLRTAPFKNSTINYQIKVLEGRYHTFNNYWQRVMKQREDGVYHKDVFKANIRERAMLEEERALTAEGAADRSMRELFRSYKETLVKVTGKDQRVEYDNFRKSLIKRAKDYKQQTGAKKLTFKISVKNGKVSVQARGKKEES